LILSKDCDERPLSESNQEVINGFFPSRSCRYLTALYNKWLTALATRAVEPLLGGVCLFDSKQNRTMKKRLHLVRRNSQRTIVTSWIIPDDVIEILCQLYCGV